MTMNAKDELLSILRAAREAADRTRFRGAELLLDILAPSSAAVREVDPRAELHYTPHSDGTVTRHCAAYVKCGGDVAELRFREQAEGYAPAEPAGPEPNHRVRGPDGRVFRFHPDYHEETP